MVRVTRKAPDGLKNGCRNALNTHQRLPYCPQPRQQPLSTPPPPLTLELALIHLRLTPTIIVITGAGGGGLPTVPEKSQLRRRRVSRKSIEALPELRFLREFSRFDRGLERLSWQARWWCEVMLSGDCWGVFGGGSGWCGRRERSRGGGGGVSMFLRGLRLPGGGVVVFSGR